MKKVVVCTEYQGVFFGDTPDATERPIKLVEARMCLYWNKAVGGVFGLADAGPNDKCRISASAPSVTLEGVTAVMEVSAAAAAAWEAAPVQGRGK